MIPRKPFDVSLPLTPGVTVVEASAGTGKTFGITTLVTRFVVEQEVPLERILLVTFTRAATAELEARVQQRLSAMVRRLTEGPGAPGTDADLEAIATRLEDEGRSERARRSAELALASLDRASIFTIHGFCRRMLERNAFESHAELGLELVPDGTPLVADLVDDYLVRRLYDASAEEYHCLVEGAGLTREALTGVAAAALEDPDLEILPEGTFDLEPWLQGLERFRQLWREQGEAACAALDQAVAEKKLNASSYKPAVSGPRLQKLRDWLGRGGLLAGKLRGDLERFGADRIRAKFLKGKSHSVGDHPVWLAFQELLDVEVDPELPRAEFAHWAREEFARRKQAAGLQTYQDLLSRLARALAPGGDCVLARAIRRLYPVVLVDEFQDTDSLQWQVFSRVFGTGASHLYLIGDPKQAIYGFRGANVHVYLAALARADRILDLERNWRSDVRLLEAMNLAWDQPGIFGLRGIEYHAVRAPEGRDPKNLWDPPGECAALEVRFVDGSLLGEAGIVSFSSLEEGLAERVAEDLVEFLESGAGRLRQEDGHRMAGPGDLAVLVSTNRQARLVQQALRARAVPAVVGSGGSVFLQPEASELLAWLEALADPRSGARARRAAATSLFGWTGQDLVQAREGEPGSPENQRWERWLDDLLHWRQLHLRRGFMACFRAMIGATDLLRLLLGRSGGERRVTDLLHLAELVHRSEQEEGLGLLGQVRWLTESIRSARLGEQGGAEEDPTRMRLETDDEAVQVVTVHKSKGLEYPFVWVPFLGKPTSLSSKRKTAGAEVRLHPEDSTRRLLDLRRGVPAVREIEAEEARERMRLLYVAMTRAQHRCVLYWGAIKGAGTAPLAPLLHGGALAEGNPLELYPSCAARWGKLSGEAVRGQLVASVGRLGGGGRLSDCQPPVGLSWSPPDQDPPVLARRHLERVQLDSLWGLTSFTGLLRGQDFHGGGDPTRPGFDEQPSPEDLQPEASTGGVLEAFPAGPRAGILLHEVLEALDFQAAPDAPGGLREVLPGRLREQGMDPEELVEDCLVPGLQAVLATPLGGDLGGFCLGELDRRSRLDELDFHLPLAGGSRWLRDGNRVPVLSWRVGEAFRKRIPDQVLRADYLTRLAELRFGDPGLAGYLTGSIDLIFRHPESRRWYLVDYKSNRLPAYAFEDLRESMEEHHYYLQYHLYAVALHRYLRARLGASYDYDRDFGGACYLFLRGMKGEEGQGIFRDRPPREVVETLDRLFEGTGSGEGRA